MLLRSHRAVSHTASNTVGSYPPIESSTAFARQLPLPYLVCKNPIDGGKTEYAREIGNRS